MTTNIYDFPPIELPPPPVASVTYRAIFEAVEKDTTLRPLEKLRIRAAMRVNPRARNAILATVSGEAMSRSLTLQEGQFGFDWQSIIDFIRELLPLILEIISWFS